MSMTFVGGCGLCRGFSIKDGFCDITCLKLVNEGCDRTLVNSYPWIETDRDEVSTSLRELCRTPRLPISNEYCRRTRFYY